MASYGPDVLMFAGWLTGRDTGTSSKAIGARMLGAMPKDGTYPSDPSDLGRCLRLLRLIPAWRARLHEMADCGPVWAALVEAWPELEASMTEEVGMDWEKALSAPVTYHLMKMVQRRARDAVSQATR